MADAEQLHWRLTLVLWCVLLAVSMGVMLFTASNKTIVIADAEHGQESVEEQEGTEKRVGRLILREEAAEEGTFYIPLGRGDKAENVTVENNYTNQELRIHIRDTDVDFYDNLEVSGDTSAILSAYWETRDSGVVLRLKMDGIYEYQNSMEGERLKINTCLPHDLYRMVVVIDPSGGGSETGKRLGECSEKEIALLVSKRIPDLLKKEDIRLYFTRLGDTEVSEEKRCALVQAVRADLYVNIGVSLADDVDQYGISGWFNEDYFIPEFGNVQLADILVRNVAVSCKNRAIGLYSAGQDDILQMLCIPAARVEIGYLTNEQERDLLVQEEYQEKLAEGIAKAIGEVYEEYYE